MNPKIHQGGNKAFGLLFSEQSFIASRVVRITTALCWWSGVSMGIEERVGSYRGSSLRVGLWCPDCLCLGEMKENL